MTKIWTSIKRKPLNLLLILVVICMYFLNNFYFKYRTEGIVKYFLVCYLNDLIAPILLISYANILLISINYEINKIQWIIFLGFGAGLLWEFVAPFYRTSATTDFIDLCFYVLGSIIYWCMNTFFRLDKEFIH